jgi:hypothetical protein
MKVTWEDKKYTFDLDEMSVSEAKTIKVHCGLTISQFNDGLWREMDPDAIRAAYWLMHIQSGDKAVDIDRLDFKAVRFMEALIKAFKDQKATDESNAPAETAPKE